ncbi:MAG: uracil-DNA glycosylase [Devosia sp.]|uniref:UdgX family uracil-DNA binding protein n=1 Tax=Devosia sp. TaxID=1871048 RepID=UPI002601D7AF|nr:UdgX family uracil-DNA binding protein [Devosia sp.]MDB5542241.1 uracil-DNA glycosylase [Devosia sp.]
MRTVHLRSRNDFDEWRAVARRLLLDVVRPEDVVWVDPAMPHDLFGAEESVEEVTGRKVGKVPQRFMDWAEAGICHSDPERFGLLYRLLWRLQKDRDLMEVRSDPDVGKLDRRVSAVRRDAHKMKAFVRFKSVADDSGLERFVAWFEPDHFVLERVAPFFVRRFTGMIWGIVTPYRSAFWDGETLEFGDGGHKDDVPADDALEPVWKSYFSSIFNPARLKVKMMKTEMPVKYWRNLPEAEVIGSLIRGAKAAEEAMIERQASIPSSKHVRRMERQAEETPVAVSFDSLAEVKAVVDECRRCPLYEMATQAVFGEGPAQAEVMFVGEQPGDQEDLAGKPFVGPAGKVFDAAMAEAGLERERAYVTNAVKHFKFVPRGKKRLHQRPNAGEVKACKFWLNLEREFVKPKLIAAMGATAVSSLAGSGTTLSSVRGRVTELEDGTRMYATVHPSYLLRIPDRAEAERERARFVEDLRAVKGLMEG